MSDLFKFDRTAFRKVKLDDKGHNIEYWLSKTVYERLAASWYLTCCAYNLPYNGDHKVDRTAFRMYKRCDE